MARNPELVAYIKELVRQSNLSGRETCRKAGLNEGALSDIVQGRTTPTPYTIDRLVTVFGEQHRLPLMQLAHHLPAEVEPRTIQEEQVLYRIEQEIKGLRSRIPIVRNIGAAAGEPHDVEGHIEIGDIVEARDPLAIRVQGSSLDTAGISKGDVVVIDRGRSPARGDIVLLATNAGPVLKFWPDKPKKANEAECIGVAVKVIKDAPRRR